VFSLAVLQRLLYINYFQRKLIATSIPRIIKSSTTMMIWSHGGRRRGGRGEGAPGKWRGVKGVARERDGNPSLSRLYPQGGAIPRAHPKSSRLASLIPAREGRKISADGGMRNGRGQVNEGVRAYGAGGGTKLDQSARDGAEWSLGRPLPATTGENRQDAPLGIFGFLLSLSSPSSLFLLFLAMSACRLAYYVLWCFLSLIMGYP
jgi:hypothetical protein